VFGDRPPGVVSLVEAPMSRSYARKARVTFYVVGLDVGLTATVILSQYWHPILSAVVGMLIGIAVGFAAAVIVLAWPVLRALWFWAAEITVALVLLFGCTALMNSANTIVALLVVALVMGVPGALGPVRRWISAWVWCQIWRHRLRLAFAQIIRTENRNKSSQVPFILLARPTPAGGRVWVWLRPGLSLEDLEGKTSALAVACWASDVRIVRASSRYAALVRVDFVRRDPLAGVVASPLPGLIPDGVWDAPAPASPALPLLGLDLDDVPEEALDTSGPRDSRRRR
jgi:hypothetical protein